MFRKETVDSVQDYNKPSQCIGQFQYDVIIHILFVRIAGTESHFKQTAVVL